MSELVDGTYDVFILDVEEVDAKTLAIELVVTIGTEKGRTLSLRAHGLQRDPIALMGLPATLIITNGAPRLEV